MAQKTTWITKRIKLLRTELINNLPKSPNNRETKQLLEKKSFSNLLIDYLNWISRFVTPRKRTISISEEVKTNPKWRKFQKEINYLLEKIKNGSNLSPHLSTRINKGFVNPEKEEYSRWDDKDLILNVMGYHHLHLGTKIEKNGFVNRTNDVLFVHITYDIFKIITIFDHSVFYSNSNKENKQRAKLWECFDKDRLSNVPPGAVVLSNLYTISGHPLRLVHFVRNYIAILEKYDKELDKIEFMAPYFEQAKLPIPKNPKFKWVINSFGISVLEEKTQLSVNFMEGFY